MWKSVMATALVASICAAGPAAAWGDRGHSIVAEIAQRHLTPAAAAKLQELLGGTLSLASIASWADDYKFTDPGLKTKPWHFINIDIAKDFVPGQNCPGGACLPEALSQQIKILANPHLASEIRRTALYFIVHLTGDSTQPFHCSVNGDDGGGNGIKADFEGNGPDGKKRSIPSTNLHAIWDEALIDAHAFSWGSYADELETTVVPTLREFKFDEDSVEAWTKLCHATGQAVYKLTPPPTDGVVTIDEKYQKAVQPILNEQLGNGGLELAAILNWALIQN